MIIQITPIGPPTEFKEFLVTIRGEADELQILGQHCLEAAENDTGLTGTSAIKAATGTPMRIIVDRTGAPVKGN